MRRNFALTACAAFVTLAACGGDNQRTLSIGGGGGGTAVTVAVFGLPTGITGGLTLTGPGGFATTVPTDTATIPVPAGGRYQLSADTVLDGARILTPQPASQAVDVAAGGTSAAHVAYADAGPLRLALQPVATLAAPLFLTAPPGDRRLFVVERAGRIRIVNGTSVLTTPFLDIGTRVGTSGEGGLLSMAFDPDYASNGFFYVYLTDPTGDIAIERYRVSTGDPNIADPAPLRIFTATHRTFTNHKGGLVAFGPDGMLYAATGDGGGGGDPLGNGQNLASPLGKLLRIDVRGATAAAPYRIPADNPFAGQAGARPEIWAYGLRNPWRFAFDPPDDRLVIADVGQGRREEINAVAASRPALNYGWNTTEGSLCYPSDPCSTIGITLPVTEYDHDASGGCSIAGGFVYRGSAIPELRGRYLYSDFCSGWIRSIRMAGDAAIEAVDWAIPSVGQVYSFGQDAQGELYLLATSGTVYRIVRQ